MAARTDRAGTRVVKPTARRAPRANRPTGPAAKSTGETIRAEIGQLGTEIRQLATGALRELERREKRVEKDAAHLARTVLAQLRKGLHEQLRTVDGRIAALEKRAARLERRGS